MSNTAPMTTAISAPDWGDYQSFLRAKSQLGEDSGFAPVIDHAFLFDFQRSLVEWSLRKGRAAIFADCGLGKSPMQLAWSDNVTRHTNGRVLILTPLAVAPQIVREGEKFGIEVKQSRDGKLGSAKIIATNYERLHMFRPRDFAGVVCDESSILKNFDGVRKAEITEFARTLRYRLTCTATAAPNDYIELGTTSEALGYLGYMDMLSKFFKNDQNSNHPNRLWSGGGWRFRGHAERDFWRWVCSWARALRKPSDLGFDDARFVLPPLITREHVVAAKRKREGMLFDLPAITLEEQREERRRTMRERCEMAAELVMGHQVSVSCCHLNEEGNLLTRLIPDAVQISGADSDDVKEEKFSGFISGQIRRLVTKESIAGFGLNLQHCSHLTTFPSHSYERYYQFIRRFWRFGQQSEVTADVITSEGEAGVMQNMKRKSEAMDAMFARLVAEMNAELAIERTKEFTKKMEAPSWL